jgi:hypothetical protein
LDIIFVLDMSGFYDWFGYDSWMSTFFCWMEAELDSKY